MTSGSTPGSSFTSKCMGSAIDGEGSIDSDPGIVGELSRLEIVPMVVVKMESRAMR